MFQKISPPKSERFVLWLLTKIQRRKYLLRIHYALANISRNPPNIPWWYRRIVSPVRREVYRRLTIKTRLPKERFHGLPDPLNAGSRTKARIEKYGKDSTFES